MKKKTSYCLFCGKPITKGKYCNQKCYTEKLKQKGTEHHKGWDDLSNDNKCIQCGKIMDANRISAYCEQCELHIEYEHEVLLP